MYYQNPTNPYAPAPICPTGPLYPVPPDSSLVHPVGAIQGFNQPNDVVVVQHLLNGVAPADGGPAQPLAEDGLCGPQTVQAIVNFSTAHGCPTDTIFPNSLVHNMLCFYSNNAGLMPNPYNP